MRVLFLSANLGGNVPPTIAVARELARRGADVEVAGLLVDEELTAVDASWAQKRGGDGRPEPLGPTLGRIFLSRGVMREAEALVRERRPDVVVVDCMALAMVKGANLGGVPVVVLLHTFAEFWRRSFLHGPVAGIVGALGSSPRALWSAAASRLLLTDAVLDPARHDPEFSDYTWTGSTERGSAPAPTGDRPRVLVSFSTTPLPGMRRAYRNTIAALSELPVDAVVTTGGFDLGARVRYAPKVQIRGFVPHAELLPGTALVIGHGGHSTTMKVLAHGVPLLVLPLNPTADQHLIGDVIEKAGLGRTMSRRSSAQQIAGAVTALLADTAVIERAHATGDRLRAAPPGARIAADRILEVAVAADR
ncbi:hypothetical protein GCM10009775_11640 [Microbacterium aoyamense]|uniref:D-inositol 3-phosphate glycosyltransferase n=1 Tax=Microbacterium aoyamense TaxID=344166 RepID=A0ABN2PH66_9MICO|nr:nucleotide disphospho-sugar-binding domain-containing protein [Microbacterium aoyamense]